MYKSSMRLKKYYMRLLPSKLIRFYYVQRGLFNLPAGLRGAELNPYRVIWINPAQLRAKSQVLVGKKDRSVCHVIDGDWDTQHADFRSHWLCRMLTARFLGRRPWDDIPEFKDILEGRVNWNKRSTPGEIWARAALLDCMYEDMCSNGFTPPPGCESGRPAVSLESKPSQIKVRIDRDGDFILETGRHRLALALITGINLVPVQPIIRHAEWQRKRIRFVGKKLQGVPANETHPDLVYL